MRVEQYERKVISMLCADVIPQSALHAAMNHPESIKCNFTGAGYYLDLMHFELPRDRIVCDSPQVIGVHQGYEVGFIVFLKNQILTLECYNYGTHGVPPEIRNGTMEISAT